MKFLRIAAGTALVAAMVAGCSKAPVFTLTNLSSHDLTEVVVSGDGFSHRIERLPAGDHSVFTIHPDEQTGVRVGFLAEGKRTETREMGYVRAAGSYRVAVIIDPALAVTVTSTLRGY